MSYQFTNFDQTGVSATTGSDLFNQGLAKVLGSILPGGEAFAGMASPFLQRLLGIQNDVMMNSTIMSNMTTYGTYMQNMNRMASIIGQQSSAPFMNAAQTQFLQGIARTMTSEEAYRQLYISGKTQAPTYQSYINSEVQGLKNNPITSTMYSMLDPMSMNQASRYMGYAATNMIQAGMASGNRNAFANVRSVMRGMFQDAEGNYNFSSGDYGGMGQGEVAALMAALTKNTDFLKDADLTKAGSLGDAAKKLRSTVQDYAKALAPLKDIFGKDIPGMLQSIEELTGQSISTLDPERARAVAIRAIDSTGTGRYSMGHLTAISGVMKQQMAGMDVPTMNRLNATLYATRALDYMRGGIAPNFMTADDYNNAAANLALSTASSNGADMFAQAYSLWANEQRKAGKSTSMEDFQSAVQRTAGPNGNMLKAAMALAGANTSMDLERGMAFEWYGKAKAAGMDQTMAFDAYLKQESAMAADYMAGNKGIQEELSKIAKTTIGYDESYKLFQYVMQLGTQDVSLFNMSDAQRRTALRERGLTDTEIDMQNVMFNRLRQDKWFTPYMSHVFMADGFRKQEQARQKASERRSLIESLDISISQDEKGLFRKIFVNGGKGLEDGAVTDLLADAQRLGLSGSKEAVREAEALLVIGAREANRTIGTIDGRLKTMSDYEREAREQYSEDSGTYKEWARRHRDILKETDVSYERFIRMQASTQKNRDEAARKNFIKNLVVYGNDIEGLSNEGFRTHLGRWLELASKGNLTKEESEEMATAEGMISAYRELGADALTRHFESYTEGAASEKDAQKLKFAAEKELATIFRKEGRQAALNFVQRRAVETKLGSMKESPYLLDMWKQALERAGSSEQTAGIDAEKMNAAYKSMEEDYKAGRNLRGRTKEQALADLEKMRQGVNEASTAVVAGTGQQGDQFGALAVAIKELVEWLKTNKTANTNTASNTNTTSKELPANPGKSGSGATGSW